MKKNQNLTILTVGLLAGLMAMPAFAGDSRGIEFTEEESVWETYVPCLAEYIDEFAVIRVSYHEFQTPSGTFHIVGNWQVTSLWLGQNSGDEWVGHGNSPYQLNGKLEKGVVEQFVSNYHMKPLSADAPPIKVQFRFKVTVNANGELVIDRFDESYRCLGPKK